MDILAWKEAAKGFAKKYRTALLVVLAGIVLLCMPQPSAQEPVTAAEQPQPPDLETRLEQTLSKIAGAGKVEVLLSQAAGAQTLYQQDQDGSGQQLRTSTVVVQGQTREESGLVQQVLPPRYLGAIVVCQGADRPQLRLELVEAVCRVTGLGADRVRVFPMK